MFKLLVVVYLVIAFVSGGIHASCFGLSCGHKSLKAEFSEIDDWLVKNVEADEIFEDNIEALRGHLDANRDKLTPEQLAAHQQLLDLAEVKCDANGAATVKHCGKDSGLHPEKETTSRIGKIVEYYTSQHDKVCKKTYAFLIEDATDALRRGWALALSEMGREVTNSGDYPKDAKELGEMLSEIRKASRGKLARGLNTYFRHNDYYYPEMDVAKVDGKNTVSETAYESMMDRIKLNCGTFLSGVKGTLELYENDIVARNVSFKYDDLPIQRALYAREFCINFMGRTKRSLAGKMMRSRIKDANRAEAPSRFGGGSGSGGGGFSLIQMGAGSI